jgi:hypothetical protein
MGTQSKRALWLWSAALIATGVVLLLDNFLLLDLNLTRYWPLAIAVLGLQLLVRGDIGFSWQAHTFGITRGSVQSGFIEVESGEIDVQLRALRKPGRLVAGQYTARSRPGLSVRNNRAALRLWRGKTWWLSLADWDVGLADDLPWSLLISSYLGRLEIDLRGLSIDRAYVTSGLGNVTLACPNRPAGPIRVRSTFGDVRLTIPETCRAVITINAGPFARVRHDPSHFDMLSPGVYATFAASEDPTFDEPVELDIMASTVFGSIYLG